MATIYLRGKTYWINYRQNGHKIQKSLKTRDKIAAKFLKNRIENEVMAGKSPAPSARLSVKVLLGLYLEAIRSNVQPYTLSNYRAALEKYFENISEIGQVTTESINAYINKLRDGGLSISTANHFLTYLKAFLNWCVKNGKIDGNPAKAVKRLREQEKPPRYLSKAEISAVLAASKGESLEPMLWTAMYTGMRYSELIRLTQADIDRAAGTITVPKSKSGKFRVIPIHKNLMNKIKLPFDLANKRRILQRIGRKAKVKNFGWHLLRHTFASQMIMAGVDIVTVSRLLGHASISTTQIYSHLSQEHIRESIKRLHF